MVLGLIGHRDKILKADLIPGYILGLSEKRVEFNISDDFSDCAGIDKNTLMSPEEVVRKSDIILSFGGDGTLLNTFSLIGALEKPIVGVNLGGLGYLTTVGKEELEERTLDLIEGRWEIEKRLVLTTQLEGDGSDGESHYALNDIVVEKGLYTRMIRLNATVDGNHLTTYMGDGVIIATPTGSTAYNLSAAGPILEPTTEGIVVTPINPHSLSNKPLILTSTRVIQLKAYSENEQIIVNVDGQVAWEVKSGTKVVIKKAPFKACLVRFEGYHFYKVLKQKLGWGSTGNSDNKA